MQLSLQTLEEQLYLGHIPGDCPYLPDRQSRLMFLHGQGIGGMYRLMLDAGYRRHGLHLYRPDCPTCRECRVLRIPTETFRPSRSQRRVRKKGREVFHAEWGAPEFTQEKVDLYTRYLALQHRDPGANDPENLDPDRYEEFFVHSFLGSATLELRLYAGDERRLCGVGIVDRLHDALSSVYFFFDPEYSAYSPGTYSLLLEIETAREWGLKYYYPGYYIKGCAAMNYKANFGPAQIKDSDSGEWRAFVAEAAETRESSAQP